MKEANGCVVPRMSSARTEDVNSEAGCAECRCRWVGPGSKCLKQPPASEWATSPLRRAFDIAIAVLVLAIAAIPALLIAVAICATSRGGAVFSQMRVGRRGHLFRLYKFRTMAMRSETDSGIGLTSADDERVTPIGRILRKFKLDELPQFYNVLRGEMSLVGPRPKLPQYEPLRDMPYRPGLTGAATLIFRREEDLLRFVPPDQIEDFYEKRIKFVKARVDVCAMCRATPISDLKILAATVGLRRQPSVRFVAGAPID